MLTSPLAGLSSMGTSSSTALPPGEYLEYTCGVEWNRMHIGYRLTWSACSVLAVGLEHKQCHVTMFAIYCTWSPGVYVLTSCTMCNVLGLGCYILSISHIQLYTDRGNAVMPEKSSPMHALFKQILWTSNCYIDKSPVHATGPHMTFAHTHQIAMLEGNMTSD